MAEQPADILEQLKSLADPQALEGMRRYGINPVNTLGISMPKLRDLARRTGQDHQTALKLWDSGIHEARILAGLVDDPKQVSPEQMEAWAKDFDSWDVCDQVCGNLFDRTPFAVQKAIEWSERSEEFVKRAGFVLMAGLAVHAKKMPDEAFETFFPIILREATDGRNFVRKAVNWALRQIGKRSLYLNERAIETAWQIQKIEHKKSRWIASNALDELTDSRVQARITPKA
ncbi:MAG TPA: DNA alkylation repair protein [Anaerolineales bacterium]